MNPFIILALILAYGWVGVRSTMMFHQWDYKKHGDKALFMVERYTRWNYVFSKKLFYTFAALWPVSMSFILVILGIQNAGKGIGWLATRSMPAISIALSTVTKPAAELNKYVERKHEEMS